MKSPPQWKGLTHSGLLEGISRMPKPYTSGTWGPTAAVARSNVTAAPGTRAKLHDREGAVV